ncbi:MAG: outer membrane protein transport protein [Oricola sp.]|jgi:long-chain fatty acid transport protein|nr:outer membrane protein transport protein [Oricola sp.]
MKTSLSIGVAPLTALAVFGQVGEAAASGFALNTQSAEALGAATAGAQATPGTPGNAYFNPASIVGVDGFETSLSIVGVWNDTSYSNAEAALFGVVPVAGETSGQGVIGDGIFPTGAVATKLSDRLFAGVAVYAPYGFNSEYADASVARYHGTFSEVVTGSISPLLGVDLGGGWSIAAGPRFQYMDSTIKGANDAAGIEAALLMTSSVPGSDDVFYKISGDDWGVGFTAGFHGKIGERITIGASYLSKIDHQLEGSVDFRTEDSASAQTLATIAGIFLDTDTVSTLSTPATVQFGAQIEATTKTRLMVSAAQIRWERFEELTTSFANPAQPDEVITQNWQNTWGVAVGMEHDIAPAHTVRLGAMYEEDPVNPAYASPRLPGASRVWLAAGYSHDLSDNARLHLAASYVVSDTGPVSESGAYPENLFRGSYEGDWKIGSVVAAVGLDWKF